MCAVRLCSRYICNNQLTGSACRLQRFGANRHVDLESPVHAVRRAVHDIGPVWDDEVLADPEVQAAIRDNGTVRREYIVTNQDRSALGRIGGAVARVHGALC